VDIRIIAVLDIQENERDASKHVTLHSDGDRGLPMEIGRELALELVDLAIAMVVLSCICQRAQCGQTHPM